MNRYRHSTRPGPNALRIVVAAALLIPAIALAHGGHGKPEYQFTLEPESVENPDAVVIRQGDAEITRREFFDYVASVSAFQMKGDLLQRDFLLHFWIVEGLSRYYPSDINERFARLVQMDPAEPEYDRRLDEWVLAQADLFARIDHYYDKAIAAGKGGDPAVNAVLDSFAAHAKADLMEDLVSYGEMDPDPLSLRLFAGQMAEGETVVMGKHYKDPGEAAPFERKHARTRWIKYRRDLLKDTSKSRAYKKVETLDVSPETLVARVGDKKITMADFLAIYGPIPNDVNWNQVKMSRGSQLVRAYALAQELDRLGIAPPSIDTKIAMARRFYLAAAQIVEDHGPAFFGRPDAPVDFQLFREVAYYPNLVKFEPYFHDVSEHLPGRETLWIDKEFLTGVKWKLAPAYTPEQAKFF